MMIMLSISSICTIITLLSASWIPSANGIKPTEKIANLMKIYSDAEQKAMVDGLRTVKLDRNQKLSELSPIDKGLFIEECIKRFQMMVSSSAKVTLVKSGEENQTDEQDVANKNDQASGNNVRGCESLWKLLGENEDHNRELRLSIQGLKTKLETAQKKSELDIEQRAQQEDIEKRRLTEENSNLKRHVEQLKQEAIQNKASIMSQLKEMKTTQQALLVEFDRMISEKNQLLQDLEMCRAEKDAAEVERDTDSQEKMQDKGIEDKIEATQREIEEEWIKVTDDTNDTNKQLEMWIELATGRFARLIEVAHELNSNIKDKEHNMKLKEYKQRAQQARKSVKKAQKLLKLEEKLMNRSKLSTSDVDKWVEKLRKLRKLCSRPVCIASARKAIDRHSKLDDQMLQIMTTVARAIVHCKKSEKRCLDSCVIPELRKSNYPKEKVIALSQAGLLGQCPEWFSALYRDATTKDFDSLKSYE